MTTHALLHTLQDTLHRHHSTDGDLFLACSGGRDSLSLAFACVKLHDMGVLAHLPTLIHVHHGLQACADEWAKGVQAFANRYNMPCIIKHITLTDKSEQTARVGRYRAFFECMNDGDTLLMAHHQDDQAETVLLRLIGGTGLSGLAAMQKTSQKHQDNKTITILRPWLDISRSQISDYAHTHHLPYVDDPTNTAQSQESNARAIIRTHLKEALHTLNPKAYANIARTAQVLQYDKEIIQSHIQTLLDKRMTVMSPQVIAFDVYEFDKIASSLQITLVRAFAKYRHTDSPNHRLSSDLVCLAARTDPNHQSELFWQTSDRAYVFYRYKSMLYRYDNELWQALQSNIMLTLQGSHGRFDWQGGSMIVQFDLSVISVQKIDKTTKISIKNHQLHGKKLYQTLKIPAHHRRNLWYIHSLAGDFVLGVGQVWVIGDNLMPRVRFFDED